jgi:hypothetical protein
VKENSPTVRITHDGKRKLQTQQAIGDFSMSKLKEKITTSPSKTIKLMKRLIVGCGA